LLQALFSAGLSSFRHQMSKLRIHRGDTFVGNARSALRPVWEDSQTSR
jgi:hypothetical protein